MLRWVVVEGGRLVKATFSFRVDSATCCVDGIDFGSDDDDDDDYSRWCIYVWVCVMCLLV